MVVQAMAMSWFVVGEFGCGLARFVVVVVVYTPD